MRNDIHRPSAIVPKDYEFVSFDYCGPNMNFGDANFILIQRQIFREHMIRTGGKYAKHENNGSCHICGAVAFYLVRWYHAGSNSYIETGEDCARKLDMSFDGDMNLFRHQVADAREAHSGKRKAIATLADAGLSRAWEVYEASAPEHAADCKAFGRNQYGDDNGIDNPCTCDFDVRWKTYVGAFEERTIKDIVGKLVKYGSISEKQAAFIRTLIAKIDRRPIIEAQRAAEHEAAAPCPTSRVRITGVVVGKKIVEDLYNRFSGERTCIIVKDNSGFKVYGSQFSRVQPGETVDFIATVKPSDKDNKFGFFKRPKMYVDKELEKFLKTVAWG